MMKLFSGAVIREGNDHRKTKIMSLGWIGLMVLMMAIVFVAGPLQAARRVAGEQVKMKINITGSIIVTGKCTFNQGGVITVDFGDIRFSSNGNELSSTYLKPLISDMTCSGDTGGTATMVLSSKEGDWQDYSGHKLLNVGIEGGTTTSGLGIMLKVDGQTQDVNTPFAVDVDRFPTLEAELMQTDGSKKLVSGNKITSSATLTMAFD